MELIFSEKYNNIIEAAKKRGWTKKIARKLGIKTETHHIMPRSLYPELIDEPTNKVELTTYEHLVAHVELALYNKDNDEMICAANRMLNSKDLSCLTEQDLIDAAMARDLFIESLSRRMGGKNNPMSGVHLVVSDETRMKQSAVRKGKKHTEQHSQNIANALIGHEVKQETRIKLKEYNTKYIGIVCINTNEYFYSSGDAGKKYNISAGNILYCCEGIDKKGKPHYSAGKLNGVPLKWRFATPEEIEQHRKEEVA